MDVLFGSIDVRELLSTTDLDSSSPLSVPDLRVLIDRLQIRSLHIKKRVQDYIISHHSEFSDIFANSSSAVSKTDDISNDVGILLDLISNHPIDNEIREIVDEIGRRKKELIEKKEVLGMVKLVVGLVERLKGVRESLRVGKFVDAAEGVRDLRIGLCISGEGNEVVNSEPKVFGLLRKEWMDCFEQVEDVFANVMSNAVRFEGGEVRVKCRVSVGGVEEVEVRTVLTAMEVIGVLDYGLAKVADLLIKFVVIPTVSNGYHFDFVEDDIEGMDEAVLYSRRHPTQRFGYLRVENDVSTNALFQAIPDDASKLPEFQKIIEVTSEFETALEEIEFISGTDDKDRRLSDYAQNIEVGFASRKKKELMAKARNLILQCDFSVPPEYTRKSNSLNAHGVAEDFPEQTPELLFMPERCIISKAGAQLMELVHQVLQDICLSSARVSREFYYAARDVLLLYEAIIPVQVCAQEAFTITNDGFPL
ncbi:hypothetical protein IFM89_025001 [Coptis chinensis]|uniref:Uncharacterized protein n=1 Tax=Coptis chinensis TaxID=261450 RepID=A0A835HXT4_9MAGN|nr:hypothetical protein IFM89_025001 [Coptis chinensis]